MIAYVLAFMFFYFPATSARVWKEEEKSQKPLWSPRSMRTKPFGWLPLPRSRVPFVSARGARWAKSARGSSCRPRVLERSPKTSSGQAREALARWRLLGPCGYTGEPTAWGLKKARRPGAGPEDDLEGLAKNCPLAFHRLMRAKAWRAAHPFNPLTASLP